MRHPKNGWPLSAPPRAYFHHHQFFKNNLRSFDENWRNTSHIRTQWMDSNPHPPMCFRVNGRSLAGLEQEFEKPQENSKINVTLESTKLGTPWKFYAWTRHYIRRLKLEFDSVAKICTAWTVKFVINLLTLFLPIKWSTTSNLRSFKWYLDDLNQIYHIRAIMIINHSWIHTKGQNFKKTKSVFELQKVGLKYTKPGL